tara:strand:+ start:244 stop:1023 length:780 start_codon:yes stop_codon:yes gene_type:complete
MTIIGISGKKQSGKNTTANILHALILKDIGAIEDWSIGPNGTLSIYTEGGWGEFDITRKDSDFLEYAEYNMWPYVKLYSFADELKRICIDLFGVPFECAYGTDDEKNRLQDHLLWEDMPKAVSSEMMKKILPPDARTSWGWREGKMTAREFMQFFGTDIMRKIHTNIWVDKCIRVINKENSQLPIVADVRFHNEAKAIEETGGVVIRLTRSTSKDEHSSETALDDYPFTTIIENKDGSIDNLIVKVKKFYKNLKETQCL